MIPARIDSTLRPICFGIDRMVTQETAEAVGPEKFKRYEHALYIGAQLSRLVYQDTGIMWYAIEASLGMSNDIVNGVIDAYNQKFEEEKRTPISSQPGDGHGLPMESYSLKVASSRADKYATYVSTPNDMTCLFLNATKLRDNKYSIFMKKDLFIAFKGSSSRINFKNDLFSQFTPTDFGTLLAPIGITVEGTHNRVTGSFAKTLVEGWSTLHMALQEHVQPGARLFLCGHSLGGAYASLFAFLLAEGKVSATLPIMKDIDSIHILSYGAPTVLGEKARNTFNRHLDSGLITLDRVVSQRFPALCAATQLLIGGLIGPNDVIPTIPIGFSHPGFRPLSTERHPQEKGRPYSLDQIRTFYGVPTENRYREDSTWAFPESMTLNEKSSVEILQRIVKKLTGVLSEPEGSIPAPKDLTVSNSTVPSSELVQVGGALKSQKEIYKVNTKQHIPNFISVRGAASAYSFAHSEYLGMIFRGAYRGRGRKNPAKRSIAYFELCSSGVRIRYEPWTGVTNATPKTRRHRPSKKNMTLRRR